jgi:hypothetical protein
MDAKLNGFIRVWIYARKFGFIVVPNGTKAPDTYFLHHSKIVGGEPKVGASVLFNISPLLEGELPSAIDVEVIPAASVSNGSGL